MAPATPPADPGRRGDHPEPPAAALPGAGWYPDPLRRFALRYWDGVLWTTYAWNGAVQLDARGTEPTPAWTARLAAAFKRNRGTLAALAILVAAVLAATIAGASHGQLAGDLTLWVFAPVLVVANLAERWAWIRWLGGALVGLVCLGLLVASLSILLGGDHSAGAPIFLGAAVGVGATLVRPLRRFAARLIPLDPARTTHTLALQVSILWLATWLLAQTSNTALDASSYSSNNVFDAPLAELPLLAFGFLGVGLLVRRNPGQCLSRLALVRPRVSHLVVAVVLAQLLLLVGVGADYLTQLLTPGTAKQLNNVSQVLYGNLGSAFLPWLLLAVSAGVCEEILFRGAVQPRLGLLLTTLLFASTHVQYGLSIVLALIVLAGFTLGVLRRYTNTTTTIVCHALYDLLAGLTFPLSWFLAALLLQLPVVAFLVWRSRAAVFGWLRTRPVSPTPAWPASA
ncbi:MAG: type II CAAX prenyl endopeptidase Rce1 family protein [Chloroflexota bacterium]